MAGWPYNTKAWARLRRAKLSATPMCEYCPAGVVKLAVAVDHKVAINDGGDAWAWSNLASACAPCHNRKTRYVEQLGRARVPVKGCDADGKPLDPAHWWNR